MPSNPFSFYLFVSALIALFTAILVWRRRSAPGAMPLFLLLLTMFIWAGANGFVLEAQDPKWQIFWFNVLTFGAVMGTPAFWAFGVEFTDRKHWLTPANILLICSIPVIAVLLGWTTEYHGLFYAVRDLSTKLPSGDWNFAPGPFYWVYIIYSYLVAIFIFIVMIQAFLRASPIYRKQTATILAGSLVPLVGNAAYMFIVGVGKGDKIDPTPLLFIIMGCIYAYGLFKYRLFDVVPIARHTLVEHMQDGVIVVDAHNRIVDVNPSALKWLSWKHSFPAGKNIRELLDTWFDHFANLPVELYVETEVHTANHPETYFDLRVEPIRDRQNILTGRLIVFRDITRQKMAEKALRDAHDRLRIHLHEIELLQDELREQALRDPLTGLFNRRYMQETIERELARAIREGGNLSVCMADIDNFKAFNDQHGHNAGDLILKALSEIFITYSRTEDVVCRYGGEEFLILMPGADLDVTMRRAEDWRRAFEQMQIDLDGNKLSTTLSLGVAVFPQQGRTSAELLKLADEALYISKNKGKNQVNVANARGWEPST